MDKRIKMALDLYRVYAPTAQWRAAELLAGDEQLSIEERVKRLVWALLDGLMWENW